MTAEHWSAGTARRIQAPDGRFWTVHRHPGVLSYIVEATTEALPTERYRWHVNGWGPGRRALTRVASALRTGEDPTPAGATLLSHEVAQPRVPPTGNVHLV
jgi:hypothetical protein